MNKASLAASGLGLAVLGAVTGYWWGTARLADFAIPSTGTALAAAPAVSAGANEAAASGGRRILYYRNPMGLPDTSPVPKKDPMGMDYVPVYEGGEPEGPGVNISLDKMQKLGVKTEAVAVRAINRTVRATGAMEVDERAERTVSPRFEGWIQRLHVNATGQVVQRGQPLLEVYSPDLLAAQQEYIVAVKGVDMLKNASPDVQANMRNLVEGSLHRLRNWDIAPEELSELKKEGRARELVLRSPWSGVVLEKPAVQGMRFMPGEMLFKIADLSSLWLLADIFEQDLGLVRPGQVATIRVNAYPDRVFQGRVSFIYPTVTPETRAGKVRIELRNPGYLLKPAMYATVELAAAQGRRLAVPESAVLDSGTRQLVLVQRGEGLFEPREVNLGLRGDGYVQVIDGVKAGEEVVVSANFLIDSESNLKAAVAGLRNGAQGSPTQGAVAPAPGAKRHTGTGQVEEVDLAAGAVSIAHEPVPDLKWPAMTMEFKLADPALLGTLKPGMALRFEFIEQAPGRWVIVRASPAGGQPAVKRVSSIPAHQGH